MTTGERDAASRCGHLLQGKKSVVQYYERGGVQFHKVAEKVEGSYPPPPSTLVLLKAKICCPTTLSMYYYFIRTMFSPILLSPA